VSDPVPSSPPPRRLARLLTLVVGLAVFGAVIVLGGFLIFLATIQAPPPQPVQTADGIVVLTGAAERIVDATNLLIEKKGTRLLITGVHPDTTLVEISRTVPATQEALECCVELGRSALNTRGNAIETAEWARKLGFRSLIVVTSAWHMPRALVELKRAMPDIELVPYPVVTRQMQGATWWTGVGTGRLLFIEYVKYVAAYLGVRSWPAVTSEVPPPPK